MPKHKNTIANFLSRLHCYYLTRAPAPRHPRRPSRCRYLLGCWPLSHSPSRRRRFISSSLVVCGNFVVAIVGAGIPLLQLRLLGDPNKNRANARYVLSARCDGWRMVGPSLTTTRAPAADRTGNTTQKLPTHVDSEQNDLFATHICITHAISLPLVVRVRFYNSTYANDN